MWTQVGPQGWPHSTMDTVLTSHLAALGSNPGFGMFFSDVVKLIDCTLLMEWPVKD